MHVAAGRIGYNGVMAKGGALGILFFGLPAGASAEVLSGLLADGVQVAGVILPAISVPYLLLDDPSPITPLTPPAPSGLSLVEPNEPFDTLRVAWAAGLPVLAVGDFAHPDTLATLAEWRADVAVVACFTQRIPPAVLGIPRWGFLNLHPSLLPAYRGPTPVFWQLRDGAATGATVHYLDEGLDTGDIADQIAVPLPDGVSGPGAERLMMRAGLDLLRGVLAELARGIVQRRPQPAGGSYFGFPGEADFALSTGWPARRAFNFMRGTADWNRPYRVEIAGRTEWLATADDWSAVELDRPSVRHGRHILIRFNPGILYANTVR
jgi:methionyl-tRNA formyltransferase